MVPPSRVREMNRAPLGPEGSYVLYWMIAARRTRFNYALEEAVNQSRRLGKPLVVLEALRVGYPWASERFHRFALAGMADNSRVFSEKHVTYYPYVEPGPDAGKGLLDSLAAQAVLVVTDDSPLFFLPRMMERAAARLPVRTVAVDSNGLLPLGATQRAFPTAYAFRRFLQKTLPAHLAESPRADPLRGAALPPPRKVPPGILRRWPTASPALLAGEGLSRLPIDHGVGGVPERGGSVRARALLSRFLEERLDRYAEDRNHPDRDATSGLSPYLHFGHLSSHEILAGVAHREEWTPESTSSRADGKREGWWGLSPSGEAFLDQLVTWRELGQGNARRREDAGSYDALPAWARDTLARHAKDRREHVYDLAAFESARTHDPLWNAAQVQLVTEGRIHNYLRMLWGKKILEWSPEPRAAFAVMNELNDKYALDGRDPNSRSGISWVLGAYDRPWGPERPIFGTVRYMSSENTRRKVRVAEYLARYDPDRPSRPL